MSTLPATNGSGQTPFSPAPNLAGPSQNELIIELLTTFVKAWKQPSLGPKPPIESFLRGLPEGIRAEALRALLECETELRRDAGEEPTWADYKDRFPDDFDVLASLDLSRTDADGPPGFVQQRELGRGGEGVVWLAFELALRRWVALKRPLTSDCRDHLERFRREAKAASQIRHPNILQVYQVGEHQGLPFFTMEFIRNGTLAEHLAHRPEDPRNAATRLKLLAEAMAAAHAEGLVHRDLKPSNVLLAPDGTPMISDFGNAKRIEQGNGLTKTGIIRGTPNYMAPEQACGDSAQIGPATDIYALGAILYECLTGRPPFVTAPTPDETRRLVLSEDPVSPRKLTPGVPRDLETICLKCLHKEPGKRYSSAAALADDLARLLKGEPIHARRSSAFERMVKWAKRQPAIAASTVMGLLCLLLLILGGVLHDAKLRRSNADLRSALDENRRQKKLHREAMDTIVSDRAIQFFGRQRDVTPELTGFIERILLPTYQEFAKDDDVDERGQHQLAKANYKVGHLFFFLSRYKEAREPYQTAAKLFGRLVDQDPRSEVYRDGLASSLTQLAKLDLVRGNCNEGQSRFHCALDLRVALLRDYPDHKGYRLNLAECEAGLGLLHLKQGDVRDADDYHRAAECHFRELMLQDKEDFEPARALGQMLSNRGGLLFHNNDLVRAKEADESAIAVCEDLIKRTGAPQDYVSLAEARGNLGVLLGAQVQTVLPATVAVSAASGLASPVGQPWSTLGAVLTAKTTGMQIERALQAQARSHLEQAEARYSWLVQRYPEVQDLRYSLATSVGNLGLLAQQQGDFPAAEKSFRQTLPIEHGLYDSDPDNLEYATSLGATYCNLGNACGKQIPPRALVAVSAAIGLVQPGVQGWNVLGSVAGVETLIDTRSREARDNFTNAIRILQSVLKRNPQDVTARQFLHNSFRGRIDLGAEPGQRGLTQLVADWEQVLTLVENPGRELVLNAHKARAEACYELGRFQDAIESYTIVIKQDPDRDTLRVSYLMRANAYYKLKQFHPALGDINRAVELADTEYRQFHYRMFRATLMVNAGRVEEGVAETSALANGQNVPGPILCQLGGILALAHARTGQPAFAEEAINLYRKAWRTRSLLRDVFLAGLRNDANLASIRNHNSFQRLLRDVDEAAWNQPE